MLQFIKFGIIGISNTIIGYLLTIATLFLLRPFSVEWDYIAGNIVCFLLSVLWSFYWNNRIVFKLQTGEKRSVRKALMKTYASYAFTGVFLNNILSWLWIDIFSISKYIAPIFNLIIAIPINFFMNKLWAFKAI